MSLPAINNKHQHTENESSKQKQQPKSISFCELFRFANKQDYIYICLGTLCSIIIEAALPFFSLLWGNMTDTFKNPESMVNMALDIFIQYILFGVGSIFGGWGMQYFWQAAGESQANKCRKRYIQSLMRQEIGWYETQQSSQIVSRFVSDTQAFQLAIGDKIALVIYLISMFVSGLVISFKSGWKMTLVVLASMPILIFSWWLMEFYRKKKTIYEEEIFQGASGMAQEALQAIKIVKQMNGQAHEEERFDHKIKEIKNKQLSFNIRQLLIGSFTLFCLLFSFTLAYWFGSECVQGTSNCPSSEDNHYTGGVVLTIFFGLVIPAINLNQLAPSLESIIKGKIAAARIFAIIDRQPLVKSVENPVYLPEVKGVVKFENVFFSYPKDKSKIILQDLNFTIDCKSSGIMGQSGCGKSTILQLIMRLYDPDEGKITLDGVDIKQLDLQWLRKQIGYVGQEPILFSSSIKENLLIEKQDASDEEMLLALRNAEILDFVAQLSDNVNTNVGAGGSQLSGGQKQRIAIARALLKNPTILLLDEATSALDRRNQMLIQHTLNKVITDKISITVAHRLQTIKNCDKIFSLDKGKLTRQQEPKKLQKSNSFQSDDTLDSPEHVNSSPSKSIMQRLIRTNSYKSFNSLTKLDSSKEMIVDERRNEELQNQQKNTYRRLFSYAEGKIIIIIVGIIGSLAHGLVMPSMGIHVARILAFNLMYSTNKEYYSQQIRTECYYMVATCIVGPIAVGLQTFTASLIGSSMTNRVRQNVFRKALRLPMSWFESKENNIEKISITLGADMITMSHIVSRYFSHLSVALSSIVFGLLLAFYFQWRTALVSIGLIPLIGASGVFQTSIASGYLTQSSRLYEQSSKIIAESLNNFKTVLSFCSEKRTVEMYTSKLDEIQAKQSTKKLLSGLVFGISFVILFVVYGLIFYLAAVFIRSNDLEITNAFSAVFLILFSGMIAGNNAKNIPDLGRLKVVADKLFEMIDLKDQDELQLMNGSKRINKEIKGNISFRNVSFKYENRDQITLKNVSFDIKQGEKLGIVGSSGCGKSTILKLLLGFYQCSEGRITIDGEPIEDYDIHCLRKHFCAVSQEPELFDETVEYNIIYNMKDTDKEQFDVAVLKAKLGESKQSLQTQQYEHFLKRKVGPRGSHLSGGQKQRVAIARAILRKPNILLLDEATSALDKQNELKVQQCLDTVMIGRTSINVTHKLQTLGNSTRIFVFKKGQLVEQGTFNQLLEGYSCFYRLLNGLEH